MGKVLSAAIVAGAIVLLVGLLIDQQIHTRFAIISAVVAGVATAVLGKGR